MNQSANTLSGQRRQLLELTNILMARCRGDRVIGDTAETISALSLEECVKRIDKLEQILMNEEIGFVSIVAVPGAIIGKENGPKEKSSSVLLCVIPLKKGDEESKFFLYMEMIGQLFQECGLPPLIYVANDSCVPIVFTGIVHESDGGLNFYSCLGYFIDGMFAVNGAIPISPHYTLRLVEKAACMMECDQILFWEDPYLRRNRMGFYRVEPIMNGLKLDLWVTRKLISRALRYGSVMTRRE